jgi:hypothetical protein
MKKIKEGDIQKQILDYLKATKQFHWRNNTGTFYRDGHFYKFGEVGSPDIFLVKGGKIYGIEVKSEDGKQSDNQKTWQKGFEKAGGIYLLARSVEGLRDLIE